MNRSTVGAYGAVAIAAGAALVGLVAGLVFGGAVAEKVVPGLGDAGTLTRWGLPIARLAMNVTAALTVGALLVPAALLPLTGSSGRAAGAGRGRLSEPAIGFLRAGAWIAAAWATAAIATLLLTISDVLGEPIGRVLTADQLSGYIGQIPQGTALMIVILLALVIALLGRTATSPGAAFGLLLLALVAVLPPPLTGHAASAGNHGTAVTGLALHVAAVVPWVGGLVMVWYTWAGRDGRYEALDGGDQLGVMAGRFSRMALWCYIGVGVSGLVNVISRLPDPAELLTTDYGRLVLGKMAAFALLGLFGMWHRDRTLPAVARRAPHAFVRLAAVEVAVMAATMGLAVALARTAPPVSDVEESPVKALLGYDMPAAVTPGRLAGQWQLDFFFALTVVVLGGLYTAALVRLRRRGDAWSIGRSVSFFVGLLSIVLVTQTGVARYSPILFSVHMAQHMVLSMLTPIFLVLGAPVTLALRALKPARVRGDRGPREWLTAILHSRVTRVLTHPGVVTTLFVVSTFVLYFTPLFESAMRNHLGHIAMTAHFLITGTLFFWVLVGVDPAPTKLPYVGRLLLLFVTMPFHAFFGLALMSMGKPLAAGWYRAVDPPWGVATLTDQHTGGAIAWGFGEIPTFIVLIALAIQWYLEDQRYARRLDRQSDRAAARQEDDELAVYNAKLAALAERDRGQGSTRAPRSARRTRSAGLPRAGDAAEVPEKPGEG